VPGPSVSFQKASCMALPEEPDAGILHIRIRGEPGCQEHGKPD
jgi:hypothetical protein